MNLIQRMKLLALLLISGISLALTGCGMGGYTIAPAGNEAGGSTKGSVITGIAHGGQTPIAGGKVYLFAAGAPATGGGYGTGATSLLTNAVLTPVTGYAAGGMDGSGNYYAVTNSTGYFTISNDYTCPTITANSVTYPAELYLLLTGGDSGAGENSNIAEIAALGPCTGGSTLSSGLFVVVDEITTAAAVYALQQFMAPPSTAAGSVNIGAPATNLIGLQNAFTTAANLADITQGTAPTVIGTATPESDKLTTIGNILAHCINSNSAASISTDCGNLFASVTPASTALSTRGVAASTLNPPLDTVAAMWYMAQFPTNVGGANCGATGGAFQCASGIGAPWSSNVLSAEPNDWTLAVGYAPKYNSAVVLGGPNDVAIDFYGNAWISNSGTNNSVVALSPGGAALFVPVTSYTVGANSGWAQSLVTTYGITSAVSYSRSFLKPRGVAVDSLGNVWVTDSNGAATTNETAISGGTFTCTGTCYFGTVAEFSAASGIGTASGSATGYYVPIAPWGIAADASSSVYFALAGASTNYGSKTVGKLTSSGVYSSSTNGFGSHGYYLAVDNNTMATSGPLAWAVTEEGCTATAGGEASIVFQFTTATIARTTTSGLTGVNTGCTTSVTDKIAASTGMIGGIGFDGYNGIWLANSATEVGNSGTAGTTGAINTVTYGITSVASGKASVPTDSNSSVASSAGAGGLNNPQWLAVDGLGNAWVANNSGTAVSAFSVTNRGTASMAINSLSGGNGFSHAETGSALSTASALAIDLSGNVWVTSPVSSTTHYVTVIVGAAAPTNPIIPGKMGVLP